MMLFATAMPINESAWMMICIFGSVIVGTGVLWRMGHLDTGAVRLKLAPFAIIGGLTGALGHDPIEDWYETRYSTCAQIVTQAELEQLSGKQLDATCNEYYDTCNCRLGSGGYHQSASVEIEDNFALRDETLFEETVGKARASMNEISLPEQRYSMRVNLFDDGKRPVLLVELREGGRLRVEFAEGTTNEAARDFVPTVLDRKLVWRELVGP